MAVRRRKTFAPIEGIKSKETYEKKPEFEYDGFIERKSERKLKPGKDRFFHSNYKHEVKDPDAYCTVYQLVVNESSYERIQLFLQREDIEAIFEPHIIKFLDDCFLVRENWDRFAQDMKIVSRNIKDVLFRVEAFGEDFPNDLWVGHSLNGKYHQADAYIHYPEFDPAKVL